MDTETRSSLNSKSFLYTIRPMHLSDEPTYTYNVFYMCFSAPRTPKTALVHFPTCLLSLFSVLPSCAPPSTPVITATALA